MDDGGEHGGSYVNQTRVKQI